MFRNRGQLRGGFTLVEILTVVIILGIISAVIIPQIGTRDDLVGAAAARTVVSDLLYAQNLAIANQKTYYVKFDVANNKYSVLSTASSGGDTVLTHPVTQLSYVQKFGSTVKGYEKVTINSATFNGNDSNYQSMYTIAFDELGSPYVFNYSTNLTNDLSSGSVVIKSGTFTTTISVSAYTGEIQVQ